MPFLWLLLMLVVIVQNFLVWKSDKQFTASLARQNKITLILTHIQVTVGLLMLIGFNLDIFQDMGSVMGDAAMRFKYIEHPATMLIGAALVTVGNAKSKRSQQDKDKAKHIVIWFGIGLLLMATRFPWSEFLQGA
jgi:lauroyl/myristoyl acyltransferase|tara:strand:- start:256 stop:660 length:405 start_codon:yes stop_codon:yes gene_type:complete